MGEIKYNKENIRTTSDHLVSLRQFEEAMQRNKEYIDTQNIAINNSLSDLSNKNDELKNVTNDLYDKVDNLTNKNKELNNLVDDLERKISLSIFFGAAAILLAILSAFVNLWFTSSETRRLSKIEFDDEKYTVEHNYSTMYSEISTITDNETGKKYIVIQTPNGTIVEDKETSDKLSIGELK